MKLCTPKFNNIYEYDFLIEIIYIHITIINENHVKIMLALIILTINSQQIAAGSGEVG